MCGAVLAHAYASTSVSGSSPRVRSGLIPSGAPEDFDGIISACAERSWTCAISRATRGGSSPRVRSGLPNVRRDVLNAGIISACAERSYGDSDVSAALEDHLRVCGAVHPPRMLCEQTRGSSPRVRSGRLGWPPERWAEGIISACAERSVDVFGYAQHPWDHLRVCGAVSVGMNLFTLVAGSSPRVRSGQLYFIGIWSGWMVRNV